MSVEQKGRATSPVHLHVTEETPVHVHIKKPKKPEGRQGRLSKNDMANMKQRSRVTKTTRNGSPPPQSPDHWVPPPAKTSPPKSGRPGFGASLRLDTSDNGRSLSRDDLSTDDDEKVRGKMRQYERKIDSLLHEMGGLKSEVELEKSRREVERREEQLATSQLTVEEQDRQLRDYQMDLHAAHRENRRLRQQHPGDDRSQHDGAVAQQEYLMKKLIEVEMCGQAVARQLVTLRDTVKRLHKENRVGGGESAMLAKQKNAVTEGLREFEDVNRELRALLHSRHEEEAANLRLMEQRDLLLKKLSEADISAQQVSHKLQEKDRLMEELRLQLNSQRDETLGLASVQESLVSTQDHLHKQLKLRDADCNRLAAQVKSIESELAHARIEQEHTHNLLLAAQDKAARDKDALKKATRVQKERAARSEDAVDQLRAQLLERDSSLADMRGEVDTSRALADRLSKERNQALADVTDMRRRVAELENTVDRLETECRNKMDATMTKLHDKTTETTALRMDNERLKMSVTSIEEKLEQAEREVDKLKSNLRQYEGLVDEYRTQVNRSRRELDESYVQLEQHKLHTSRVSQEGELELEKVRVHLQARLDELEPLPQLLKTCELKLHTVQEQLAVTDRRHDDSLKTIGEQQAKLSQQVDQLEQLRSRLHVAEEERVHLNTRLDLSQRKLEDADDRMRELLATVAKREEALHQANLRLEEKSRDNAALSRQLEAAMADTQRQVEQVKDRCAGKERILQSRVLDLESQIGQLRTEVTRSKRDKEEAERKFNSKLYDLKDRLEQSASTNRSMQSYVQFLKGSYTNMYSGDGGYSAAAASLTPTRSTLH